MKTRRWGAAALLALATILTSMLAFAGSAQAVACTTNGYNGCATTLVGNSSSVSQGGSLGLTGSGWVANESVNLTLHSTPVGVGTAQTDANGNFSATVTIPSNTPAGSHYIEASDSYGNTATFAFTVTAAGGGNNGGGSGGGLAGTGVAVVGIGALGVVLLVGGGLMLMAGRRRKTTAI